MVSVATVWTGLYWCWIGCELAIAVARRAPKSAAKTEDRGSLLLLWAVIFPAMTACEWIRHTQAANIPAAAATLDWVSLAVLIAGLGIRWFSILTLGRSFTANVAIQAGQTVHRTGLYAIVRHPSYLGLLLVFVAEGLRSKNWLGLGVATIPTMAAMLYRIGVEEGALTRAFGDEYVAYSRATKRLIPGLF